ncbi:unnamed protein product [Moneuplotes crassus]|uniref:Uncharacterized protein n=1 Tax=Euplotes crassus TaxID=5936 RepID=A0AAD1XAY3_EUPCR|nr:unnamed protein product [Moneuplotes crassus]
MDYIETKFKRQANNQNKTPLWMKEYRKSMIENIDDFKTSASKRIKIQRNLPNSEKLKTLYTQGTKKFNTCNNSPKSHGLSRKNSAVKRQTFCNSRNSYDDRQTFKKNALKDLKNSKGLYCINFIKKQRMRLNRNTIKMEHSFDNYLDSYIKPIVFKRKEIKKNVTSKFAKTILPKKPSKPKTNSRQRRAVSRISAFSRRNEDISRINVRLSDLSVCSYVHHPKYNIKQVWK